MGSAFYLPMQVSVNMFLFTQQAIPFFFYCVLTITFCIIMHSVTLVYELSHALSMQFLMDVEKSPPILGTSQHLFVFVIEALFHALANQMKEASLSYNWFKAYR